MPIPGSMGYFESAFLGFPTHMILRNGHDSNTKSDRPGYWYQNIELFILLKKRLVDD